MHTALILQQITTIIGVQTLRTQDSSDPRHFGTSAEVSVTHFSTSAKLFGHIGSSAEVSYVQFCTKEDTSAPGNSEQDTVPAFDTNCSY